jgi:hypothetical protein
MEWSEAMCMRTFKTLQDNVVLELSQGAESVTVTVEVGTDLSVPFTGTCTETGEHLHFPSPWTLNFEVQ